MRKINPNIESVKCWSVTVKGLQCRPCTIPCKRYIKASLGPVAQYIREIEHVVEKYGLSDGAGYTGHNLLQVYLTARKQEFF